jgi:hypothetical protein
MIFYDAVEDESERDSSRNAVGKSHQDACKESRNSSARSFQLISAKDLPSESLQQSKQGLLLQSE